MQSGINLFDRMGGIRPMAVIVGEKPSTVQSWKTAGRIPAQKQPIVIEKANAAGIKVTAEDVVYPMGDGPDAVLCDHERVDIAPGVGASTRQTDEMSRQAAQA